MKCVEIGRKWTEVYQIYGSGPNWTEMDQINRDGSNRLVDRNRASGLKCYIDVAQQERSNHKCYTFSFKYYIDIDVHFFFFYVIHLRNFDSNVILAMPSMRWAKPPEKFWKSNCDVALESNKAVAVLGDWSDRIM